MTCSLFAVGKYPCRFYYQVNSHLRPRYLSRVSLGENLYIPTINYQIIVICFDLARVNPVIAIVFKQMGVCFGIGQVIYSSHLNFTWIPIHSCPCNQSAYPTKSIYSYTCHHHSLRTLQNGLGEIMMFSTQ